MSFLNTKLFHLFTFPLFHFNYPAAVEPVSFTSQIFVKPSTACVNSVFGLTDCAGESEKLVRYARVEFKVD